MVEGFIRLMDSPDECTGPINLGNPNEFSIKELAEHVVSLTGSKSEIVCKPLPEDDPKQRCRDISLAMEKLGWTPKIPLEQGLIKTIAYFEDLLAKGL